LNHKDTRSAKNLFFPPCPLRLCGHNINELMPNGVQAPSRQRGVALTNNLKFLCINIAIFCRDQIFPEVSAVYSIVKIYVNKIF
jgi:hypothetical protein